jgi:hypothetical protein
MSALSLSRTFSALAAAGTVLWWAAMLLRPEWREPFVWPGLPDSALLAFLPADAAGWIGLPLAYAWTGKRLYWVAFLAVASYSTLIVIGLCIAQNGAWLGVPFMLASTLPPWGLELWMRRHEAS